MDSIKLKHWSHTCGDGCCYSSGIDVFINDERIEQEDTGLTEVDVLKAVLDYYAINAEVDYDYDDVELGEDDYLEEDNQLDLFDDLEDEE